MPPPSSLSAPHAPAGLGPDRPSRVGCGTGLSFLYTALTRVSLWGHGHGGLGAVDVGIWQRRWIADDGLIVLRTVRNLLAGNGPVFNASERVESNTSTAWTIWCIWAAWSAVRCGWSTWRWRWRSRSA